MIISFIVAVGLERQIGQQGKMPWNYPSEYQHFIQSVSGHHILLGRVNWEDNFSNTRLLSRVTSLIISNKDEIVKFLPSQLDFNIFKFSKISDAINFAKQKNETELFIIGGEKIYQQTLSIVDRIYYSVVPYLGPADTFFPEIPLQHFKLTMQKQIAAINDSPSWQLQIYDRI